MHLIGAEDISPGNFPYEVADSWATVKRRRRVHKVRKEREGVSRARKEICVLNAGEPFCDEAHQCMSEGGGERRVKDTTPLTYMHRCMALQAHSH